MTERANGQQSWPVAASVSWHCLKRAMGHGTVVSHQAGNHDPQQGRQAAQARCTGIARRAFLIQNSRMLLILTTAALLCTINERGVPSNVCMKRDTSAVVTSEGPLYRPWTQSGYRFLSGNTIRIGDNGVIRQCNSVGQNCR